MPHVLNSKLNIHNAYKYHTGIYEQISGLPRFQYEQTEQNSVESAY